MICKNRHQKTGFHCQDIKKQTLIKRFAFLIRNKILFFLYYFKGPRPDIMLYKITITAMTIKVWIKLPVAMPGTMPKKPNSQITIHMTATSQSKLLII